MGAIACCRPRVAVADFPRCGQWPSDWCQGGGRAGVCSRVGSALAGRVAHGFENAGLGRGGLGIGFASAITRGQAGQSLGEEALLPGINRAVGASELAPDRAERVALGEQENDRGAARFAHRDGAAAEAPLQFFSFPWRQSDLAACHAEKLNRGYYTSQGYSALGSRPGPGGARR